MKRQYVFAFTAVFLLLAIIIVMLIQDSKDYNRRNTVYEVAVVIRGKPNSYWDAVKQGIDQAVSNMSVDLSYITMENDYDAKEQAEAIRREVDNGAQAIVIAPIGDEPELRKAVEEAARQVVVIEIESRIFEGKVNSTILADNKAMAEALGKAMLNRRYEGEKYVLLLPEQPPDYLLKRYAALIQLLENEGAQVSFVTVPANPGLDIFPQDTTVCMAALDSVTLQAAAETISVLKEDAPKLCGIGGGAAVAYYIENGTIDFAISESAFNLGYLSIKSAVDILRGQKTEKLIEMDFRTITAQNIYEMENQRLLFPFVK